jgi:hypothetical protein
MKPSFLPMTIFGIIRPGPMPLFAAPTVICPMSQLRSASVFANQGAIKPVVLATCKRLAASSMCVPE